MLTQEEVEKLRRLKVPVPPNEAERINILREAQILDTDVNDPLYDRYTSMATRILNCPTALISLVDLERQWFKSKVCLGASETSRDASFCTYVVLPDCPDIFVVKDATTHPIFSNNILVTGPPFIRFYAGTPIIIDGIKIGSFCVIDYVPHAEVTLLEKMTLLDLGCTVAHLITERRAAYMRQKTERDRMILGFTHNLRTSLTGLTMATYVLRDEIQQLCKKSCDEIQTTQHMNNFKPVEGALSQLRLIVEASLALPKVESRRRGSVSTFSNLISVVENTVLMLSSLGCMSNVQWNIDNESLQYANISQPDVFYYVLLSSLSMLIVESDNIQIHVTVQPVDTIDIEAIANNANSNNVVLETELQLSQPGRVVVEVRVNGEISNFAELSVDLGSSRSSTSPTSSNNIESSANSSRYKIDEWKLFSVKAILKDVKGSNSIVATPSGCCFTYSIPCDLFQWNSRKPHVELELELESKVTEASKAEITANKNNNNNTSNTVLRGDSSTPRTDVELPFGEDMTSTSMPLHRIRCLVIDDSVPIQKVMKKILIGYDCDVTVASNGKQGLEYMKTKVFDVIFIDFLMPIMDGLTAMKEWKLWKSNNSSTNTLTNDDKENIKKMRKTILIGMSATASPSEQEQATTDGMMFFCPKPVAISTLDAIINILQKSNDIGDIMLNIYELTKESSTITAPSKHTAASNRRSIFSRINSLTTDLTRSNKISDGSILKDLHKL